MSNTNKRMAELKARRRQCILNGLNKNSRIMNFGSELLTHVNHVIVVDHALSNGYKSDKLLSEEQIGDVGVRKQYVLASVRKHSAENSDLIARLQDKHEHLTDKVATNSAQTTGTATVVNNNDRRNSQQSIAESYSRKICELDQDPNILETTLDEPGVFRTDGVGGKSVVKLNVKNKTRPSVPAFTKGITSHVKRTENHPRPLSLNVNKSALTSAIVSDERRASSVTSATELSEKNEDFRTRSKSLPKSVSKKTHLKLQKQNLLKATQKNVNKSPDVTVKQVDNGPKHAWSNKTVVSVSTQTEEEYTGTLLYLDETDDFDNTMVSAGDESRAVVSEITEEIRASLSNGHFDEVNRSNGDKGMEEAMKLTNQKLTKSQKKGIKAAFDAMDLNHDGKLSANELRRACKQLGILLTREELEEIIMEADTSKNGTIEYTEFEKLVGQQLVIANYKNKQLRDAFRKFDKDGDGYITAEEIRTVFRESGVDLDDDEINELVEEADENGDGVISFEEFVNSVCEKDW